MKTGPRPPLKFRHLAIAWAVAALGVALSIWRETAHGNDFWAFALRLMPALAVSGDEVFSRSMTKMAAALSGFCVAAGLVNTFRHSPDWSVNSQITVWAVSAVFAGLALIGLRSSQRHPSTSRGPRCKPPA